MECEDTLPCSSPTYLCFKSPRDCVVFRKLLFFYGQEMLATAQPEATGPPLIGCLRLLIRYISNCLYMDGFSSRNVMTHHALLTMDSLNMIANQFLNHNIL
jgi:hypothetical protein